MNDNPIATQTPGASVRVHLGRSPPDIIYGANDGIITRLAVVSGGVGGNLSPKVVLILGFANLLADGVSMGRVAFRKTLPVRQLSPRRQRRSCSETMRWERPLNPFVNVLAVNTGSSSLKF